MIIDSKREIVWRGEKQRERQRRGRKKDMGKLLAGGSSLGRGRSLGRGKLWGGAGVKFSNKPRYRIISV